IPTRPWTHTQRRPPVPTRFPYTTLFRSPDLAAERPARHGGAAEPLAQGAAGARARRRVGREGSHLQLGSVGIAVGRLEVAAFTRSEEHTAELQSRGHLVCRLLLEKKEFQ